MGLDARSWWLGVSVRTTEQISGNRPWLSLEPLENPLPLRISEVLARP